jgi:hypothetical protein
MVKDGDDSKHECCPYCESWNYFITNLSIRPANGMFFVEYSSPELGMTLFTSKDSTETWRVLNRMMNLKWDVFNSVISEQPAHEARLYLSDEPCLINNFTPLSSVEEEQNE